MSDVLQGLAVVALWLMAIGAGLAFGYGIGWREGLRDAAKSARFSADLRRATHPQAAQALDDLADRQERRAAAYERKP